MHLASATPREANDRHLSPNERAILRCNIARQCEEAGDYEGGSEAMEEFWQGVGARPSLVGLDERATAHVLLRVGALTGWIGSVRQIEGSQELAKNLISESLRILEDSGARNEVGVARSDLALCYWREGAFDEARVTLEEALTEVDERDIEQKARVMLRQALIERESKRLYEALQIHERAAPLFDEIKDYLLTAHFHHGFANVLNRLSSFEHRKDYIDRALIEYAAASFYFEQAAHKRFQACVENNLGFLLGSIGRFEDAHEHLDRAQMLMTRLKDSVHLGQVDETRARVMLAEGRTVDAEKIARSAVRVLEKGDELSLLAEALTTHGISLARLNHTGPAHAALERAIDVSNQAGDFQSAGLAALAMIEELRKRLTDEEIWIAINCLQVLLRSTQDLTILRRIAQAFHTLHQPLVPNDWSKFSLRDAIHKYEAQVIKLALKEAGGSVTRAARLLGFRHHQSLISLMAGRHRDLVAARSVVKKRRHHLIVHPKPKGRRADSNASNPG